TYVNHLWQKITLFNRCQTLAQPNGISPMSVGFSKPFFSHRHFLITNLFIHNMRTCLTPTTTPLENAIADPNVASFLGLQLRRPMSTAGMSMSMSLSC